MTVLIYYTTGSMGHWIWKEATDKSDPYDRPTVLSRENFQTTAQGGNASGESLLSRGGKCSSSGRSRQVGRFYRNECLRGETCMDTEGASGRAEPQSAHRAGDSEVPIRWEGRKKLIFHKASRVCLSSREKLVLSYRLL